MSRAEGLKILQRPCYETEEEEKKIKSIFKKMGWSEEKLKNYIEEKEVSHDFYKSEKKTWIFLKRIYQRFNLKFLLNKS